MGIGDKQRMERERREKYAEAIHTVESGAPDVVDRVLALVDAEIEPLQEQVEEECQRHALLIGRVMLAEALLDALPYEIMKDAETRGDLPMSVAKACADRVRYLVDGYTIARDHGVQEPEYEYALRSGITGNVNVGFWSLIEPAQTYAEEQHQRDVARLGSNVPAPTIVRRRTAGEWEDVK